MVSYPNVSTKLLCITYLENMNKLINQLIGNTFQTR
jgi:hypothetical protein